MQRDGIVKSIEGLIQQARHAQGLLLRRKREFGGNMRRWLKAVAAVLLTLGRKNFPASDLKGLIAYLKENPDGASVGIAGVGATGHLTGISFQKETGTKFTFVPYRGNGPAMQDLLSGQIDFMIEPSSNFRSLLSGSSVKPFAVTGKTRLKFSPDIPTADE